MSDRLEALYKTSKAFEELLEEAEDQADSEAAETFVKDMRARYKQYGMRMFLSAKQHNWLLRIATGEDSVKPADDPWRS